MLKKLESLHAQIQIRAFLGPLFFLLALAGALFKGISHPTALILAISASYILSVLGRKKALLILLPLLGFTFMESFREELFWHTLLVSSLLAASFLTIFCAEDIRLLLKNETIKREEELGQLHEQKRQKEESLRSDLLAIQKVADEGKGRVESYKKLVDVHQEELQRLRATSDHFVREALEWRKKVAESEQEKISLLDHLNEARTERFQLEILHENPPPPKPEEPLLPQISEWEIQYRELKKQFKEKTEILNQTRKELFLMENSYLALQKESATQSLDENIEISFLTDQLKDQTKHKESLEEENRDLEKIISTHLKKKSNKPRPKVVQESFI